MDKRLVFPFLLAALSTGWVALSACSGSGENVDEDNKDIGSKDSGPGEKDSGGGGNDSGGPSDAGTDSSSPVDAGAFGRACTQEGNPGDCPSGLQCFKFNKKGLRCTRPCTPDKEATDCPETKQCGNNLRCSVP